MQTLNNTSICFGQLYMPTNHQIAKQWGKSAGEFSEWIHDAASKISGEVDIYIKQTSDTLYDIKVGPKRSHTILNAEKRCDLLSKKDCTKRTLLSSMKSLKRQILGH